MNITKRMVESWKRLRKTKGYKLGYEEGLKQGKIEGRESIQNEFRHLLDIPVSF